MSAAASWREAELRKEHEENAKVYGALKKALLGGLPAEHREIRYQRVSAIIYRRGAKGGYILQIELLDPCGGSVTIASPRAVKVIGVEQAPETAAVESGEIERMSGVLKKALLSEVPVICEGKEYRRVSAILYRRSESGGCRIQAELEGCGDERVVIADIDSVQIENPGTCDEMCWINEEIET